MKRILFITSSRLGDAVLSTGLVDYLLKTYPEAKLTIACGGLATSLFEGTPNIERIITMKKRKRAGHWVDLWKQTIGIKWDIIVDLRNSAVSRLLRVKQRYVFGMHIPKDKHKVEQNAAVMRLDTPPAPTIWVSPAQKEKSESFVTSGTAVLGVGPAANWPGKMWPTEYFIELIQKITAPDGLLPNARVAVFAAPGEEDQSYPVLYSVPKERQIDMIAKADPGTVAASIAHCSLYIGNDSGLMHCAAAAKIPTFGLFGPSYPHLYAPWGPHTDYARTEKSYDELTDFDGYSPETQKESLMTSLSVETVWAHLQKFWKIQKPKT